MPHRIVVLDMIELWLICYPLFTPSWDPEPIHHSFSVPNSPLAFLPSCVRAYDSIQRTMRARTTVRDTCTIPDRMASFLDCFVWGETTSWDIVMNSPTRVYVFQGKAVLKCAYLKCIILQLESSTLHLPPLSTALDLQKPSGKLLPNCCAFYWTIWIEHLQGKLLAIRSLTTNSSNESSEQWTYTSSDLSGNLLIQVCEWVSTRTTMMSGKLQELLTRAMCSFKAKWNTKTIAISTRNNVNNAAERQGNCTLSCWRWKPAWTNTKLHCIHWTMWNSQSCL